MKRFHATWWLTAAALAIALLIIPSIRSPLARTFNQIVTGSPSLSCPVELQFGEVEAGKQVTARFKLGNRGRLPLHIEEVQTSCACTGLELDSAKARRLASITLNPNEELAVRARVTVAGRAGYEARHSIRIRSDDPKDPDHAIQVVVSRVLAGVTCQPDMLAFGQLDLGKSRAANIDVFDGGISGRIVERVETSRPNQLTATYIPSSGQTRTMNGMNMLGKIAVEAVARESGPIDGCVRIFLAGEHVAPDEVWVYGTVVPPIQVVPNPLVLPVAAGGKLINEAVCLVRRSDSRPFRLTVGIVPDGYSAIIESGSEEAPFHRVRVSRKSATKNHQGLILLREESNGTSTQVSLFVSWIGA